MGDSGGCRATWRPAPFQVDGLGGGQLLTWNDLLTDRWDEDGLGA
jgi:hypothetical protein